MQDCAGGRRWRGIDVPLALTPAAGATSTTPFHVRCGLIGRLTSIINFRDLAMVRALRFPRELCPRAQWHGNLTNVSLRIWIFSCKRLTDSRL